MASSLANTGGRPPVVLFDLDGTLLDSAPGVERCLRETFDHFGIAPLRPDQLRSLIGPPFSVALPAFIGDRHVDDVISYYRTLYTAGGMYEAALYPGIAFLVEGLVRTGVRLAVATSKLEAYIAPILARMGILDCFEVRCGHDERVRTTKALVVAEALRRLDVDDAGSVVMVGDRRHDVIGAAASGVPTVGAGWGYGAEGELAEAGATAIFDTATDLAHFWNVA